MLKWFGMGQQGKSQPVDPWTLTQDGTNGRYFGLANFGNTCYANAVLQALYFCRPFREWITRFPHGLPVLDNNASAPSPTASTFDGLKPSTSHGSLHPAPSMPSDEALANNHSSSSFGKSAMSKSSSLKSLKGSKEKREERSKEKEKAKEKEAVGGTTAVGPRVDIGYSPSADENLFTALKDLFWKISSQKRKTGVVAPTQFISKLKKENELFRSTMQQDAHEFLNYVLNTIADTVLRIEKESSGPTTPKGKESTEFSANAHYRNKSLSQSLVEESFVSSSSTSGKVEHQHATWVHAIFEGVLTNETKCLTCETVTNKDESFLDLSIDIEENTSVTACLRQFSASEMMCHKNKFFCDVCCGLQEAEKRMKIKKLPNVLALHLKRFKYQERIQKYIKLSYRVVFPMELRLFNTADTVENPDRLYSLFAFVVHLGTGPYHGHYVAVVKSYGKWLLFDDENVEAIEESDIEKYFGDLPGTGSGYVLFYQANDLSLEDLGIAGTSWSSSTDSDTGNGLGGDGTNSPTIGNPSSASGPTSPSCSTSASSISGLGSTTLHAYSGDHRGPTHWSHDHARAFSSSSVSEYAKEKDKEKEKEGGFSWFPGKKDKHKKEKKEKEKDKSGINVNVSIAMDPHSQASIPSITSSSPADGEISQHPTINTSMIHPNTSSLSSPSNLWFSKDRRKAKQEEKEKEKEREREREKKVVESAATISTPPAVHNLTTTTFR